MKVSKRLKQTNKTNIYELGLLFLFLSDHFSLINLLSSAPCWTEGNLSTERYCRFNKGASLYTFHASVPWVLAPSPYDVRDARKEN